MKKFKLNGRNANWKNGLRMSALDLHNLEDVETSPIPHGTRMYVSVANNVFHVKDTRREIVKGNISEGDKSAILNTLKSNTPDFMLTLEDKVVGFASLICPDGTRLCEPAYDHETELELTDLQAVYENSEMTDEDYRAKRKEIISDYVARLVTPVDGAILLTNVPKKHSFNEDGLTEAQRDAVYDTMHDYLYKIYDWNKATQAANVMLDDVCTDIWETADWEDYPDDEINGEDVLAAVKRVMFNRIVK